MPLDSMVPDPEPSVTEPHRVDDVDGAFDAYWYTCDCDYISKYCDEHHRGYGLVVSADRLAAAEASIARVRAVIAEKLRYLHEDLERGDYTLAFSGLTLHEIAAALDGDA